LFAADHLALDDALARIGQEGIAPIAAALAGRSPIVIAGEGHARPIIALIEERIERAGRPVVVIENLSPRFIARLKSLERNAAVLAVAVGRETAVADAALQAARALGIPAVSMVDSSLSPIARAAQTLVVPTDERGGGAPGLVAFVAVAQALADAMAPPATPRALSAAPGTAAAA
jgi:DNA-binding MurR/RpiR family transcriptional regulator